MIETEKKAEQEVAKAKSTIENMRKQYMEAQVAWKKNLNEEIHKKDK